MNFFQKKSERRNERKAEERVHDHLPVVVADALGARLDDEDLDGPGRHSVFFEICKRSVNKTEFCGPWTTTNVFLLKEQTSKRSQQTSKQNKKEEKR